jgi:hypothetical protein
MPRWVGALLLIGFGAWGAYAGITDSPVTLRGSDKPLNKWGARLFNYGYAVFCISGGIAIWATR